MMTPVAILYLRLSRDDEDRRRRDPGYDPFELHRATLERLAADRGLDAETVQEIGSGGTLYTRPAFMEILRRVEAGEVKALLVMDEDRLTRGKPRERAHILETLADAGVVIHTPNGMIDLGNQTHSLLYEVKGALARYELESYKRRVRAATIELAKSGKPVRGFQKFGYTYDRQTDQYHPDPSEYPMLCFIFETVRRMGIRSLCLAVKERFGYCPDDAAVYNMIIDPFYGGRPAMRYRGSAIMPEIEWIYSEREVEYEHPLTWEEWLDIRRMLRDRRTAKSRPVSCCWLTGILRCICGFSMAGSGVAYRCSTRYASGHSHVDRSRAERLVSEFIIETISDPVLSTRTLRIVESACANLKQSGTTPEHRSRQLCAEVSRIERLIDVVLEEYALGGIDEIQKNTRLERYQRQRATSLVELERAQVALTAPVFTDESQSLLRALCKRPASSWAGTDSWKKKLIAALLFEHIIVEPCGKGRRSILHCTLRFATESCTGAKKELPVQGTLF
jgi:DNA invertase Pin-like site-specific DNA recombinase